MTAANRFTRITLRTTDAAAARAFYTALLGHSDSEIFPLHEQALARGARPHWLGQVEVADVDAVVTAFEAHGAARMGPSAKRQDGRWFTVLRDPGGAVLGLISEGADAPSPVIWHHLDTTEPAKVGAAYSALFGWRMTEQRATEHGVLQSFTWPGAAGDIGSIHDVKGVAGRHPHWLFHLRVSDLERALALVRESKGRVVGPFAWLDGARVAVCEDPQGAAFALRGA